MKERMVPDAERMRSEEDYRQGEERRSGDEPEKEAAGGAPRKREEKNKRQEKDDMRFRRRESERSAREAKARIANRPPKERDGEGEEDRELAERNGAQEWIEKETRRKVE